MKRLLMLAMLAGLAGCRSASAPPPPPTLGALLFTWGAINNPYPVCPVTAMVPCNNYLTILETATGKVIANPAMNTNTYVLVPEPGAGAHQYALYANIVNPDGSVSASEQTLKVVTIE